MAPEPKHLRGPDEWPKMVTHAFPDGTSINVWHGTRPTPEEIEAYDHSPRGQADMERLADALVHLLKSYWYQHQHAMPQKDAGEVWEQFPACKVCLGFAPKKRVRSPGRTSG